MGSVASGIGGMVSTLTGGGGGGNNGAAGMNYSAGGAPIVNAATMDQANQQYTNANAGLDQQQAFLNAVQAQNGLGNQTSVYNQLGQVAAGQGPNPAQAMLNQSTGQNVAAQNALMAGQRGAGANAGLLARQASMQGANTQQQAAGQGATMQANQSLNALNAQGQMATNMANQQSNATNAYTQAAQGEQGQILNQIGSQNNAAVGNTSSQNTANSGIANTVAGGQQKMVGNLFGGVSAAASMLAQGGQVPQPMADGGSPVGTTQLNAYQGPSSAVGQYMTGAGGGGSMMAANTGEAFGQGYQNGSDTVKSGIKNYNDAQMAKVSDAANGPGDIQPAEGGLSDMGLMKAAKGGTISKDKVPVLLSPGEVRLTPKQTAEVVKEGKDPMKIGKTVPGTPKVGGAKNDYANDTFATKEEPGSTVIPRSVTQSKNPSAKSIAFVHAIAAKHGLEVMAKKGKK